MQTSTTNRKLQFVIGVGLGLFVCLLGVLCLGPHHRELELRAVTIVTGGTNYLHVSITNISSRIVEIDATADLGIGGQLAWNVGGELVIAETGSRPSYVLGFAPGYGADRLYAIPQGASSAEIAFEYRVRGWVSDARQFLINRGRRDWAARTSVLDRFFPEEAEVRRHFQL